MIDLYHVVKRYENADAPALDDINLKVGKGDFCLLTGPSGAGKSTLLRLLMCADFATSGQVMINGKNTARLSRREIPRLRRKVGVVFQDFKLLADYSVTENIGIALEIQGRSATEISKRIFEMLKQVGLAHKAEQPASQLSGGEQQRVAIARALITDPAILLCDEPTGNLDAERSADIMELLVRANTRGTSVIVATHDPALLDRANQRVFRLEGGRLVVGSS